MSRLGKKILMNILDIEVPLIAALNGPVRLHSEYVLLADIVLATPTEQQSRRVSDVWQLRLRDRSRT